MCYDSICVEGGHMSFMRMCYGRTCVVGRHVLQVCAEATI